MATPVSFYLKYFDTLTTSMLNWFAAAQSKITDFNRGSIIRSLVEAFAMEQEVLYESTHHAIEAAIPEAIFTAFNFPRQSATKATGSVTFGRSTNAPQAYVLPQGLIIMTADGIEFETLAQVTLLQGTQTITTMCARWRPGWPETCWRTQLRSLSRPWLGWRRSLTRPL